MSTTDADVPSSRSIFKTIFQSSGLYSISNLGQPLVAMLLLPVITNRLRPEDYGVLGILEQVTSVLSLLLGGNFGSSLGYFYFQRDSAEARRPVIGTCLAGSVLAGLLTLLVCVLPGAWLSRLVFGTDANAIYLRVMAIGMPVGFAMEALYAWLRVAERPGTYLGASIARVVLGAVSVLLLVAVFRLKVMGMILSGLAASTLPILWVGTLCWRDARPSFDGRLLLRMAKFSLPAGISGLALFCINFGDRLILPRYAPLAQIGLYNLAYKIGMLASFACGSFLLYWSSQAYGLMKRPDADSLFARLLTYACGGASLMCLGLILFAKPAIGVLAHHDYSGAAALVPVLAIAYAVRSLGDFFRARYYVAGRPGYDAVSNWVGSGLCLGGYLVFIPRFGVWGAAFVTLGAFAVVLAITLVWTYRLRPYEVEGPRLVKMAIALALVLGAFLALPVSSLAGQIALGTLLTAGFPALLWIFGFPTPAERELLRGAARKVTARIAAAR